MKRIEIFGSNDMQELEEKVNDCLDEFSGEIVDIQFQMACCSGTIIYGTMIVYEVD